MSRASRQKRLEPIHEWPALAELLSTYFGERFWMQFSAYGAARQAAVESLSHRERKQVATEWWRWNASAGAVNDVRAPIAHLGVEPPFDSPLEARKFMNEIYDALIVAIRSKEDGWKP